MSWKIESCVRAGTLLASRETDEPFFKHWHLHPPRKLLDFVIEECGFFPLWELLIIRKFQHPSKSVFQSSLHLNSETLFCHSEKFPNCSIHSCSPGGFPIKPTSPSRCIEQADRDCFFFFFEPPHWKIQYRVPKTMPKQTFTITYSEESKKKKQKAELKNNIPADNGVEKKDAEPRAREKLTK